MKAFSDDFPHVRNILQPFVARWQPGSDKMHSYIGCYIGCPGATSGGTQRMVRSPSSKSSVIMFGPDDVAADPRIPWIFWSTEWPTPGTVSEPKSISDLKAKALTHALLHDLSWGQQGTFMKLQPSGLWMFESTSNKKAKKKATALCRIQTLILQITQGESFWRPRCNRGSMLAYFLGRQMSGALFYPRQLSCYCFSTSGQRIISISTW